MSPLRDDLDEESAGIGGKHSFFTGPLVPYGDDRLSHEFQHQLNYLNSHHYRAGILRPNRRRAPQTRLRHLFYASASPHGSHTRQS